MNAFSPGHQVATPKHGVGTVQRVYPVTGWNRTIYVVAIPGRRVGVVFYESDLKSAEGPADGVRCRDCAQGKPTPLANVIRCRIYRHTRSGGALRTCRYFIPIKETST